MSTAIFIGLAGALGSVSRFYLGGWVARALSDKTSVPMGTLVVNVVGSLAMGLLLGLFVSRGAIDARLRLVLSVGFLGGFTTYSSFALETVGLLEERSLGTASLYVALTLFSAGLACFLGLMLGRRL